MKMEQLQYWDRVAGKKEFTTDFCLSIFQTFVAPEQSILDVGCGYGRVIRILQKEGYQKITGVDVSSEMVKSARKNCPGCQIQIQSERGILAFPGEAFEALLLCGVLTCIADNREQERLVSECFRVLKPGGILYVNDFLLNTDMRNVQRYEGYMQQNPEGEYGTFTLPEGVVLRHHKEEYLRQLFLLFWQECFTPVTYRTMNGHQGNGFYAIYRKI